MDGSVCRHHHAFDRVEEKIGQAVLPFMKSRSYLQRNVVDPQVRIAHRAAPTVAPITVIEREHSEHWQRVSCDWHPDIGAIDDRSDVQCAAVPQPVPSPVATGAQQKADALTKAAAEEKQSLLSGLLRF